MTIYTFKDANDDTYGRHNTAVREADDTATNEVLYDEREIDNGVSCV